MELERFFHVDSPVIVVRAEDGVNFVMVDRESKTVVAILGAEWDGADDKTGYLVRKVIELVGAPECI